jgi:hypothetical protein
MRNLLVVSTKTTTSDSQANFVIFIMIKSKSSSHIQADSITLMPGTNKREAYLRTLTKEVDLCLQSQGAI